MVSLKLRLKDARLTIQEYESNNTKVVDLKAQLYASKDKIDSLTKQLTETQRENLELIQKNNRLRVENAELRQSINGTNLNTQSLNALHESQEKVMQRLCSINKEIKKRHESNRKCIICRENDRDMFVLPCRHETMCQSCSEKVAACPVCNAKIEHCHRIILS